MTQQVDLTAREAEVIRILKVLRSRSGRFVVIGGYAVSALASHRFSVDCDVVVSEKELGQFEKILVAENYRKTKASVVHKGIHGARTAKYGKLVAGRKVSVDLSINSVVCRDTDGEWSYELISRNSIETNVAGVTDSTTARVPRRELLIAMKLHPARDTDLRDVVMLGDDADWKAVAEFARTGMMSKVAKQLDLAASKIESKEFPSALKAEFGLRTDISPTIRETIKQLRMMKLLLEKETLP